MTSTINMKSNKTETSLRCPWFAADCRSFQMDIVYLLVYFTSGILAMTCVLSQLIDIAITDGKVSKLHV